MKWVWLLALIGELRRTRSANPGQGKYTEAGGRIFADELSKKSAVWANRLANAEWDYESNLTDYNLQKKLQLSSEYAIFNKAQTKEARKYPWRTFKDPLLKRQFKFHTELGSDVLPEEKRSRLEEVVAKMSDIYSTTKLLEWKDPGSKTKTNAKEPTISLKPDLVDYFSDHVEDSCSLQYYWEGWHGAVGRKEKPLYAEYVQLANEAARLNKNTDNATDWNDDFEMDNFDDAVHIHKLYLQILPFYKQLHAYVRRRLAKHHNKQRNVVEKNGCLPAHILGNVWAQDWQNVYKLTVPYAGKESVAVTPTMQAKKFTPLKMYKMAEEFYTSLKLNKMTETFWKKSIIEKPKDRKMVCHASAWDFKNGDDYRIKMCTRVNIEDFKTIHHEMGHIQYFMQYKNQPYVFQDGANSGFHEAVGDTIALSVSTAEHLIKVGLLDSNTYVEDKEMEINSLFRMALEKVAFLPFAYVLDLWRSEIFKGQITSAEYNCRYWQLRQEFQGIVPPEGRSAKDFDGGAKYHVIADVPYIRYFVSFIIQFQFQKALCIEAGQYNPKDPASKSLHHCDIYRSKKAGDLLGKMLQLGKSKPPQEAMEVITGQRDMDAGPLLEYFKPLHDWLVRENKRTGGNIGWSASPKINCGPKGEVAPMPGAEGVDHKCHYDFQVEKPNKDNKKKPWKK